MLDGVSLNGVVDIERFSTLQEKNKIKILASALGQRAAQKDCTGLLRHICKLVCNGNASVFRVNKYIKT